MSDLPCASFIWSMLASEFDTLVLENTDHIEDMVAAPWRFSQTNNNLVIIKHTFACVS